tara:strand:- start:326 stop:1033 length:708 start_codon:yes stop_codon:yes gene_type:complete
MQKKNNRNRLNIEQIITDSLKKQVEQQKEFHLFNRLFYIHDLFIFPIDVQAVVDDIETIIPLHLFDEVDEIMVGDFDFLHEAGREAEFKDGAIYITNQVGSEKDLIENILHELSHSIENKYGYLIYGDMVLRSEFLGKRNRLKSILQANGWTTSDLDFSETEYNEEFDSFLYEEVGYIQLGTLSMGLYVSPYAVTSLSEYWAVGFEDYFIGDREYIQKVSPQLFSKIEGVLSYED